MGVCCAAVRWQLPCPGLHLALLPNSKILLSLSAWGSLGASWCWISNIIAYEIDLFDGFLNRKWLNNLLYKGIMEVYEGKKYVSEPGNSRKIKDILLETQLLENG